MSGARVTPLRRLLTAAGAVLVVLMLAACGARIDTQLTVDATGAGSRVMTLTLDGNHDSLLGGTAAVDASIIRHKPAEVDYSGLTTSPAGEVVAVFTVNFANPAEYRQKMIALLAASDQEWTDENSLIVEQTRFIEGATIHENFTSQNILQWMFSGLLADGVVAEGDARNMYELGTTKVTFDGVVYSAENQIRFSQVTDRGFDSVEMETTFEDQRYSRVITYWLDDKAVYNSAKDVFDGFFAEVATNDVTVEQDSEQVGITWTAALTADSPERLVELTNAALLSEETAFAVTTGPVEDDPATSSITLIDYAECAAICSPEASTMNETLYVPAGFELVTGGEQREDGSVTFEMSSSAAEQVFRAVHRFESVSTELSVGLTGGMTWSGEFTADAKSASAAGDGFEKLLTPTEDAGELTVEKSDSGTVYTVTIAGSSTEDFVKAFGAWNGSPMPAVIITSLPGANFFSVKQHVSGALELPQPVALHMPATGVEHTVTLPFGQSFDATSAVMPEGGTADGSRMTLGGLAGASFSATVSGTSLVGMVVYTALALAALGALLLAVLMRKQISAAIARRRLERAERAPRQGPAPVGSAATAQPQPTGSMTGHGAFAPAAVAATRPDAPAVEDVDLL